MSQGQIDHVFIKPLYLTPFSLGAICASARYNCRQNRSRKGLFVRVAENRVALMEFVIAGLIAAALLGYLVYVLFHPEK